MVQSTFDGQGSVNEYLPDLGENALTKRRKIFIYGHKRVEDVELVMRDAAGSVLPELAEKPVYVNQMFAAIAGRYDVMNRIMTGGQDQSWRRLVVDACNLPRAGHLLDVATGTGDIGFEAMRRRPDVVVTGVDFTHEMLRIGQDKAYRQGLIDVYGSRLRFADADALGLPFEDDTFDAAVSGFMMRNVTNVARAFAEQRRVVRPGGRVVCLEITRPGLPLWRDLFRFYFFRIVPWIGGIVSGQRQAYTYLPQSTAAFPRPAALAGIMESIGLRQVSYRTLMLDTVALHVGTV